jgi:hypothetical protein
MCFCQFDNQPHVLTWNKHLLISFLGPVKQLCLDCPRWNSGHCRVQNNLFLKKSVHWKNEQSSLLELPVNILLSIRFSELTLSQVRANWTPDLRMLSCGREPWVASCLRFTIHSGTPSCEWNGSEIKTAFGRLWIIYPKAIAPSDLCHFYLSRWTWTANEYKLQSHSSRTSETTKSNPLTSITPIPFKGSRQRFMFHSVSTCRYLVATVHRARVCCPTGWG